ncbi:MAG: helix-hairpin-helix domain-containing protein [Candidatus Edwardsbacteria bacterium]|jgi:competence protein ComEA|nr:helix-hairpin-helix domain-containing protein [Candidatus Edwardsbacteria bacterium]
MRPITLVLLLLSAASPAVASFEETPADARVFGMASAGVALADYSQAGSGNPALPAWCEEQSASAGAALPFGMSDLAATAASAGYQRGRYGLGASLVTTGNALYRESTLRAALGARYLGSIAAGIGLGGRHLAIERYGSAVAVGLDAGVIGSPHEGITVAIAAENLNRPKLGASGDEIAQTLSCGAAWRPVGQATLALQLQAQQGWPVQLRIGQEYRWRERLFLRAGFSDRPNQASLGFGLAWRTLRLDYAARTHPVLDLSHCVSLHYRTLSLPRSKVPHAAPSVRTDPRSLTRVDLNTAVRADLLLLPGIGESAAGLMLALRDSLGGIAALDDLLAAGGPGRRALERIAPYTVQQFRPAAAPHPVDLNTATAEQLCTLPGIGPGTAADIIAHRSEHGPFRRTEDLMDVRGIGRVKFEKLQDRITVGP